MLLTMRKNNLLILVCLFVASVLLFSCDKESKNTDEPDYENVTSSNPVAGKTLKCVSKTSDASMKFDTNFTIKFASNDKFVWTLRQTCDEYDLATKKWNRILDLDKTIEGTYEYQSSKISLRRNDGGVTVLQKVAGGWADGNYIYK